MQLLPSKTRAHRPTDTFNIHRKEKHTTFKEHNLSRREESTSMSLTVYSKVILPSIHKMHILSLLTASTFPFHFHSLITLSPGFLVLSLGLSVLQTVLPYFPPRNIASSSQVIRPPLLLKKSLVAPWCLHKHKFLNLYLIWSVLFFPAYLLANIHPMTLPLNSLSIGNQTTFLLISCQTPEVVLLFHQFFLMMLLYPFLSTNEDKNNSDYMRLYDVFIPDLREVYTREANEIFK